MNELRLTVEGGQTAFEPGAAIVVTASWNLDEDQDRVELRLFWYTTGKGDRDMHVVQTLPIDTPERSDTKRLGIQLPESPYSFSGKLISLIWALELVAEPSGEASRIELIMAPNAREIILDGSERAGGPRA